MNKQKIVQKLKNYVTEYRNDDPYSELILPIEFQKYVLNNFINHRTNNKLDQIITFSWINIFNQIKVNYPNCSTVSIYSNEFIDLLINTLMKNNIAKELIFNQAVYLCQKICEKVFNNNTEQIAKQFSHDNEYYYTESFISNNISLPIKTLDDKYYESITITIFQLYILIFKREFPMKNKIVKLFKIVFPDLLLRINKLI